MPKGEITMKRLASIGLAVAILLTLGVQCFAADPEVAGYTDTSYTAFSRYTVTIPEYVDAVEEANRGTAIVEITATDVFIGSDENLCVMCEYSGELTDTRSSSNKVGYVLKSEDETIESGSYILTAEGGSIEEIFKREFESVLTEKPQYSGEYRDTVVFTISVKEAAEEEEETDELFSLEEIEKFFKYGAINPAYCIENYGDGESAHSEIFFTVVVRGSFIPGSMFDYAEKEFADEAERLDYLDFFSELNGMTQEEAKARIDEAYANGDDAFNQSLADACQEIYEWCSEDTTIALYESDEEAFTEALAQLVLSMAEKYEIFDYSEGFVDVPLA